MRYPCPVRRAIRRVPSDGAGACGAERRAELSLCGGEVADGTGYGPGVAAARFASGKLWVFAITIRQPTAYTAFLKAYQARSSSGVPLK